MSDRLAELNLDLAGRHLRVVTRAAEAYQRTSMAAYKAECLRKARAETRVLRSLADRFKDPNIEWAAAEAENIIAKVMNG